MFRHHKQQLRFDVVAVVCPNIAGNWRHEVTEWSNSVVESRLVLKRFTGWSISEPALGLLLHKKNWASSVVTWWSSCLRRLDRDSTQVSRDESWGSILLQSRDTTAMAECRVSLWTRWPLSLMKLSTQFRPPASNTAPDSRVQISSSTWTTNTHYSPLDNSGTDVKPEIWI